MSNSEKHSDYHLDVPDDRKSEIDVVPKFGVDAQAATGNPLSIAALVVGNASSDALSYYLKSLTSDLLTSEEVVVLTRCVQKLVRWEAILDVLEGRVLDSPSVLGGHGLTSLGRKATRHEWAKACGFDNVREFEDALRRGREARETMILSNLRMVVWIAKSFRFSCGSMTFLDLIREGTLGLVRAVENFDPERGFKFSTYAYPSIKHALMNSIANDARIIRLPAHFQSQVRALTEAVNELSARTGRSPTDAELMERLKISDEKLALLQRSRMAPISIEGMPWIEVHALDLIAADKKALPGEVEFMNALLKTEVDTLLQVLPPREMSMLQLRFGLGDFDAMTYREIGDHFSISSERARQIVHGALEKLKKLAHRDLEDYIM